MLLALLAGLALLTQTRIEPLSAWDNAFTDFLAMNSHHGDRPAPLTVVGINDAYLAKDPWPWSPLEFSVFFQGALPLKPDVIAIDQVLDWERAMILPDEQNRKLAQYAQALHRNLLLAQNMVLGAKLGMPDDPQVIPPLQEVPLLRNVQGSISEIPEFVAVEQQPSESYQLASKIGFTNLPPLHSHFNSVPLLLRYRGQVTPSFTLQAVLVWAKLTPDDVTVEMGSHIDIGKQFHIPIDSRGRMRVDFGAPFTSFTFEELALASEQKQSGVQPIVPIDRMTGGIVLLTRTDNAARTIPLAARRNGSPGELFAAAIATIQNQSFIRPVPDWAQYVVIAVFMLWSFPIPRMKKFKTILYGFFALAVYALVALAVFGYWLMWLPGVAPVGVVAICTLFRLVTPEGFGKPKRPVIL